MKIMVEVSTLEEIKNIEWLKTRGYSGVLLKDVFALLADGWNRCNKSCRDCGSMTFWNENKKEQKCLACSTLKKFK